MLGQSGGDPLFIELETNDNLDPLRFLERLKGAYGLRHVIYADLLRTRVGYQTARLIHDPNKALERLVRREQLDPLQPLVRLAADLYGPAEIDLDVVLASDQALDRTLSACGLGGKALLVPLVPRHRGLAFFFCNSSRLDGWTLPRCQVVRDLSLAAGLFHARQIGTAPMRASAFDPLVTSPRLTAREREVLTWVAAGKSYWEVGRILGISERTVRHFMANSRAKLDAVSNKQAVALAVSAGLIDLNDRQATRPAPKA